jgi:hypothetical protein
MTPNSFGVDLNLWEWRVGEKNAGQQWLCYCLAAAVANEATTKEWQHVLTLLQDFQI